MEPDSNNVANLLRHALDGDEQALTELITIHKGLIFTVVFRMVGDYHASEDLVQEVFIRMCLNIKKVKNAQHLRPWLCVIARNIARDYLRTVRREKTVSLDDVPEPVSSSGLKEKKRSIIIQEALLRLMERDRMLLTLSYFQGFAIAEIALVMKMPENSVKVSLHRARKRLRKELEGYEAELLSAY